MEPIAVVGAIVALLQRWPALRQMCAPPIRADVDPDLQCLVSPSGARAPTAAPAPTSVSTTATAMRAPRIRQRAYNGRRPEDRADSSRSARLRRRERQQMGRFPLSEPRADDERRSRKRKHRLRPSSPPQLRVTTKSFTREPRRTRGPRVTLPSPGCGLGRGATSASSGTSNRSAVKRVTRWGARCWAAVCGRLRKYVAPYPSRPSGDTG